MASTNIHVEALLEHAGFSQETTYRLARLHTIVEGIKSRQEQKDKEQRMKFTTKITETLLWAAAYFAIGIAPFLDFNQM